MLQEWFSSLFGMKKKKKKSYSLVTVSVKCFQYGKRGKKNLTQIQESE